jgi:hypothetical protein
MRKSGGLREEHGLHRLKIARGHLPGGGFQTLLPAHDVEQFIIVRRQTVVRIHNAGDGPGGGFAGIQQAVRMALMIDVRLPRIRTAGDKHQTGGFGSGRRSVAGGRGRG